MVGNAEPAGKGRKENSSESKASGKEGARQKGVKKNGKWKVENGKQVQFSLPLSVFLIKKL